MNAKFVLLFAGVNVVIVPDRDAAGEQGANVTASRLRGHAASVKVAVLPAEFKASKGADVRDVLQHPDGERLLRESIENAKPWQPPSLEPTTDGIPNIMQPDGRKRRTRGGWSQNSAIRFIGATRGKSGLCGMAGAG